MSATLQLGQVPAKTQQRLVHQQQFSAPQAHEVLTEVSVDGGKVRIRRPTGQPCQWKDYTTLATDVGLVAESKFQGHSGMKAMSRKCLHIGVLISMA